MIVGLATRRSLSIPCTERRALNTALRALALAGTLLSALLGTGRAAASGAAIAVTPSTIVAGASGTLTGSGFSAGESVCVNYSSSLCSTADGSGNVSLTLKTAANLAAATYQALAVGQSAGLSATTTYTVTAPSASVSASPTTVAQGAAITVSATGFVAGENVCFSFTSTCFAADGNGNVGSQSIRIFPHVPTGTVVFRAIGLTSSRVAFVNGGLTVTASSQTLTPSANPVNQAHSLTLTASGFDGSENVVFNGWGLGSSGVTVAASNGAASTTINPVTCSTPSGVLFAAKGQSSLRFAQTTVTVNAPSPALAISPTNSSSTPGSAITVSASNFASGETIVIKGPGSTVSGTATSQTFTLYPSLKATTYSLSAIGNGSGCGVQTNLSSSGTTGGILSLGSSTASTGQPVTFSTTGGIFAPNAAVTLNLPSSGNVTVTSDASGNISGSFVVSPLAPVGTWAVRAFTSTPAASATASLQITAGPTLALSSSTVAEGTSVTLTASNFAPNDAVTFTGPGISSSGVTATANGSGVATTSQTLSFGFAPGVNNFKATNGSASAFASVTTTRPSLTETLNPTSLTAGNSITISGAGFQPGETVTVTGAVCSSSTACTTPTASAGSSGNFTVTANASGNVSTSAFVPYFITSGVHIATLIGGSSGLTSSSPLTVTALTPSMTVNPTTTASGNTVTVSGSGFAPNESVSISALPVFASAVSAMTDGSGAFSGTLSMNNCVVAGTGEVLVKGQTSNLSGNAPLTFTGSSSVPSGCGFTPPASSGGGSSSTTTTTSTATIATTNSTPTITNLTFGATTSSGGVTVVGPAAANTGVADLPSNASAALTAILTAALPPSVAPVVDPAAITGSAPAPLTARVSAATGGILLVGNAAIVVTPGALANVAGGVATFVITPATNLPTPGGPAQFSPNGSVFDISIKDGNGAPVTTFPVPIPIEFKFNAADVGQARGNAASLTAAYVIDALTPLIANPNHFPAGTFVIFPSDHASVNTQTGTIVVTTQAIGSPVVVVTNPVGYVQTTSEGVQLQSSFDPASSLPFGSVAQFAYLQVVEPQIGTRLLVLNPDTGNYAYVDATSVGPSGPPPPHTTSAVVRGVRNQ